ncbi:hypothetical protein A3J19_05020 [Candidatus Daviesbacteria bacterium RIFCSPLOWO2_02_FULL_41_8]|uniref:Phytanoyl-CoA dioxygenase n=1 Tax=Candidatus Daviesbacteria bacterium RIFCSPLOWO2_02_FULL_41_8 TaxID=1797798 RepID=A0A1F5NLX7_9BACT|nr:MAG: hypothetical protein A3J19_05020 [Candidatus Daviesbacteria bacterium RIFCSPLOWO2_02_FULL_41_8]
MNLLKPIKYPITNSDIAFYDANGFLLVEDVLLPKELDNLLRVFEFNADIDFSAMMNKDREYYEAREIVKAERIVSTIERLQRWEVDVVQSQFLFKKAGTEYQNQAWNPHQDNSYPQVPYPGYITVNIFLTDADKENGCMYMYPGSHREPILPYEETVSYKEKAGTNPGNKVEIPAGYEKVDLVVKKGTMFVMNGHLIHGSYPNQSKTRSRPLYSISYVTRGVEFQKGRNANRMRIPIRGVNF